MSHKFIYTINIMHFCKYFVQFEKIIPLNNFFNTKIILIDEEKCTVESSYYDLDKEMSIHKVKKFISLDKSQPQSEREMADYLMSEIHSYKNNGWKLMDFYLGENFGEIE
jgi:hypothetical protein